MGEEASEESSRSGSAHCPSAPPPPEVPEQQHLKKLWKVQMFSRASQGPPQVQNIPLTYLLTRRPEPPLTG